ncbi:MAG: AAA family ATPase [Elusimicrobia bacterium]|nr:AAA family ATPase [Elusimicrobiota bacterium]
MKNPTTYATRALAVVLALALWLPGPAAAAGTVVRGQTGGSAITGNLAGAAGVVTVPLDINMNLGSMSLGSSLGSAALKDMAAPTVGVSQAAVGGAPLVMPQSVVAHPVVDLINKLQAAGVSLPETANTPADAAKIAAAAQAMPAGAVRDNLMALAAAITGPKGVSSEGIAKVYENGAKADDSSAAVEAKTTIWQKLAGMPVLGRSKYIQAKAEAGRVIPQAAAPKTYEVSIEKLRWVPAPESLPASTKEVALGEQKIVGQDAAVKALRFGLKMSGGNYNVYVSGPGGVGRETALKSVLSEIAPAMPTPNDMVALTNFANPEQPIVMQLPAGKGQAFTGAVAEFVEGLSQVLPRVLESGDLAQAKSQMMSEFKQVMAQRQKEFDAEVAKIKEGKFGVAFQVQQAEDGVRVLVAPTYEGQPLTEELVQAAIKDGKFTQEEFMAAQAAMQEHAQGLMEKFRAMMEQNQTDMAAIQEQVNGLAQKAVVSVVNQLGQSIVAAIQGDPMDSAAAQAVMQKVQERQVAFEEEVAKVQIGKFGVFFKPVQEGNKMKLVVALTFAGQPISPEMAEKLVASGAFTQAEFEEAQAGLKAAVTPLIEKFQAMMKANQADIVVLKKAKSSKPVSMEEKRVLAYVKMLMNHAAKNFQAFLPHEYDANSPRPLNGIDPAKLYQANLLVDNSDTKGAPVVWESHPSYERLFGSADENAQPVIVPGAGMMKSKNPGGPTLKAGSFLRASGGFLVLDAMSVLREPGAWQALMAAVRSGKAEITTDGLKGLATMEGTKYYAPAKVKVVLMGSPMLKMLLREHDDSFASAFNATAEFESRLPISAETVAGFVEVIKTIVVKSAGAVMDLTRDAISGVLEYSARLVDSNQKVTAQFGALSGLLREATFWAKEEGRKEVTGADIAAALNARKEREEGYVKRVMDTYLNDIFHVATSGAEVGQINGLAVMGTFGVPARITVTASAGAPGVVSIDREAGTTGSSFNKALGVVEGFLRNTFAQKKAISAQIRISFEQNYGGIDGDSATSTEIYATLSRLANVPIKQNYAVTGSADQFGNVQAIGGANEKIEGYFALAKARGLTGEHGIIIPASNVADLQLSPEVVQAVREGKFHIYAVKHVSQGLEILTGTAYSEILKKASARLDSLRGPAK